MKVCWDLVKYINFPCFFLLYVMNDEVLDKSPRDEVCWTKTIKSQIYIQGAGRRF